jgi:hypothetical protein
VTRTRPEASSRATSQMIEPVVCSRCRVGWKYDSYAESIRLMHRRRSNGRRLCVRCFGDAEFSLCATQHTRGWCTGEVRCTGEVPRGVELRLQTPVMRARGLTLVQLHEPRKTFQCPPVAAFTMQSCCVQRLYERRGDRSTVRSPW